LTLVFARLDGMKPHELEQRNVIPFRHKPEEAVADRTAPKSCDVEKTDSRGLLRPSVESFILLKREVRWQKRHTLISPCPFLSTGPSTKNRFSIFRNCLGKFLALCFTRSAIGMFLSKMCRTNRTRLI